MNDRRMKTPIIVGMSTPIADADASLYDQGSLGVI